MDRDGDSRMGTVGQGTPACGTLGGGLRDGDSETGTRRQGLWHRDCVAWKIGNVEAALERYASLHS